MEQRWNSDGNLDDKRFELYYNGNTLLKEECLWKPSVFELKIS